MPKFTTNCWSQGLHLENSIRDGLPLKRGTHISIGILEDMLRLCGRFESWKAKKSDKTLPFFCTGCIAHFQGIPQPPKIPCVQVAPEQLVKGVDCCVQTSGIAIVIGESEEPHGEIGFNVNDLKRLSTEQRALLAFHLAQCERENIRRSTLPWTWGSRRSLNSLVRCKPAEYIDEINPVLTSFLHGLSIVPPIPPNSNKPPFPIEKPSDIYRLCKVSEACMALTTEIAVLPFHFREVILIYSLTHSRLALDVLACSSPSGRYPTVRSICSDDTNEVHIPGGDILLAFDNNQVLKKTWRISLKAKFASHVITMLVMFEIDANGLLQTSESLKPGSWFNESVIKEQNDTLLNLRNVDGNSWAREAWYKHLIHPLVTKYIDEVSAEQEIGEGAEVNTYGDFIDSKVLEEKQKSTFKVCPHCGNDKVPIRTRKCQCGEYVRVTTSKQQGSKSKGPNLKPCRPKEVCATAAIDADNVVHLQYEDVDRHGKQPVKSFYRDTGVSDHHASQPTTRAQVLEPIFLNPCSYDALASVFRTIGKKSGVQQYCLNGERTWLAVACDGAPFIIGIRLIRKYFCCPICDASVVGEKECLSHVEQFHPWETNPSSVQFSREFDWLLLLPGPGHIEMNMIKAFVKITWPVFWESLVEIFNFKTEAAKKVAMNVSDHHKGWSLCLIAFEAIAKELIVPFIRSGPSETSCAAFFKFVMGTKDPNYAFLADITFETLGSILLYRVGVRSGQSELMTAARYMFSKVWSAGKHPQYRELDLYDIVRLKLMPKEVQAFVAKSLSLKGSGTPFSAEGPDFRLEEMNKVVQNWIPAIPKDRDWRSACVNHKLLLELRTETLLHLGLPDPKDRGERHTSNVSDEVAAFRTILRQQEYCTRPHEQRMHISLKGEKLHEDLVSFSRVTKEKWVRLLDSFIEHYSDPQSSGTVPFNELPLFITAAQANDFEMISKRTIPEIILIIRGKLDLILDTEQREMLEAEFEADLFKKRAKKQRYLDFLQTLLDVIEEENSVGEEDASDVSDDE